MNQKNISSIAVFCGSATGNDPAITTDCLSLAKILCANNIKLVYGGGNVGLMGILADEMLRLGGEVIGVIPKKLVEIEVAHTGLTHMHIVPGMHERKALMAKLADAFMVLPGGIGTMDEFFEMFTWQQLGYHNKPIAICNVNGFYNRLLFFLENLVLHGYVKETQVKKLLIFDNSTDLVHCLLNGH
jgi:uncharacterized protein (TIGR00730 family)